MFSTTRESQLWRMNIQHVENARDSSCVCIEKGKREREREEYINKMKVSDRFFYLSFYTNRPSQIYTSAVDCRAIRWLSVDIRYKVTIFLVCPRLEATQPTHIEKEGEIPDVSVFSIFVYYLVLLIIGIGRPWRRYWDRCPVSFSAPFSLLLLLRFYTGNKKQKNNEKEKYK